MKNSASIYWSDNDGLQVSEFEDDGRRYPFGVIGNILNEHQGVMSLIGENSIGRYGTGYNRNAVSFIGSFDSYGRIGGVI